MVENIVAKDTNIEQLLIIGGGDLKIARHIFNNYPLVKKITVCEIDPAVVEITEEFFPALRLTEEMKAKIEIVNLDGNDFLKNAAEQIKFDGIIVDCSDVCKDESISCSLFTSDFYRQLLAALKPSAAFSQMLTLEEVKPQFMMMVESSGFDSNIEFVIT